MGFFQAERATHSIIAKSSLLCFQTPLLKCNTVFPSIIHHPSSSNMRTNLLTQQTCTVSHHKLGHRCSCTRSICVFWSSVPFQPMLLLLEHLLAGTAYQKDTSLWAFGWNTFVCKYVNTGLWCLGSVLLFLASVLSVCFAENSRAPMRFGFGHFASTGIPVKQAHQCILNGSYLWLHGNRTQPSASPNGIDATPPSADLPRNYNSCCILLLLKVNADTSFPCK